MIIVTTNQVEGKRIVATLGMAKGSTIRARNVGRDIIAGLRNLVGGEVTEYTAYEWHIETFAIKRDYESILFNLIGKTCKVYSFYEYLGLLTVECADHCNLVGTRVEASRLYVQESDAIAELMVYSPHFSGGK